MAQKTYTGKSPILVPENEKIVSIAFPSEASSITSLDIPETTTIDVTACNDGFVWGVLNDTTKPNKKITANNKIYYTAMSKVAPHSMSDLPTITSHEFDNGNGVITFATDVTSIGYYAFDGCSGLTSITIPDSVTSIGKSAFQDCSGLTSIIIPDGVTSIGDIAFWGCSGLTSITIPDSVTSIGNGAFYNCSGLTSINVSEGNTKYDSRNNCNAIIETATNTLISGCQNTIIPDSVTSIGGSAFYECSGLTSITIPDGVTSIGDSAFFGCSGLTSITIPDGVTSIDGATFRDCSGLISITIPDGVTSIGNDAFMYCIGLTSITIPDSVTSIGDQAFWGCSGLTSITFNGTMEQFVEIFSEIDIYSVFDCTNGECIITTTDEEIYI